MAIARQETEMVPAAEAALELGTTVLAVLMQIDAIHVFHQNGAGALWRGLHAVNAHGVRMVELSRELYGVTERVAKDGAGDAILGNDLDGDDSARRILRLVYRTQIAIGDFLHQPAMAEGFANGGI